MGLLILIFGGSLDAGFVPLYLRFLSYPPPTPPNSYSHALKLILLSSLVKKFKKVKGFRKSTSEIFVSLISPYMVTGGDDRRRVHGGKWTPGAERGQTCRGDRVHGTPHAQQDAEIHDQTPARRASTTSHRHTLGSVLHPYEVLTVLIQSFYGMFYNIRIF